VHSGLCAGRLLSTRLRWVRGRSGGCGVGVGDIGVDDRCAGCRVQRSRLCGCRDAFRVVSVIGVNARSGNWGLFDPLDWDRADVLVSLQCHHALGEERGVPDRAPEVAGAEGHHAEHVGGWVLSDSFSQGPARGVANKRPSLGVVGFAAVVVR
jgi:hypothetical protein